MKDTKPNKTVLEHLLDNNKKMILASRYQNTIYNDKTLCEYFGVESQTTKAGDSLSELINEMIYELPAFDYKHFIQNIDIYKKYSQLHLRIWMKLYSISKLIKHFEKYKDKEWIPIISNGIRWVSDRCCITYINKNTMETKEKVLYLHNEDAQTVHKLFDDKRDESLKKAKWLDYETLKQELALIDED